MFLHEASDYALMGREGLQAGYVVGRTSSELDLMRPTSGETSLLELQPSTVKQRCEVTNEISPDKRAQDICNTSTESGSGCSSVGNDSVRSLVTTDSEGEMDSAPSGKGATESAPGGSPSNDREDEDEKDSAVEDDEDAKPPQSYIALISMALLESEEKKLLLGEIYSFIQDRFSFYRNATDKAWRNSIRHNLSLNECFIKAGRADNGKGNYWAIHPACVEDFKKGDFRRRHARRRARRSVQKHVSQLPMTYRATMGYVPMTSVPAGPKMMPVNRAPVPPSSQHSMLTHASSFYPGLPGQESLQNGISHGGESYQHPGNSYHFSSMTYSPAHASYSYTNSTSASVHMTSTPSYTARYGSTPARAPTNSACAYSTPPPYSPYLTSTMQSPIHPSNTSANSNCFRDTTNLMSRDLSSSFSSLPASTYNYISALVESSLNSQNSSSPLGLQSQSVLQDALAGLQSISNL